MSNTPPCPKCGAETDDIGSKLVCGTCYWVFDKGGPLPKAGKIEVPTPQRPAPVLSKDPKAPLPTISQAPQAAQIAQGPVKCPKCMGETTDVGSGRLVCGDCYWVIEPTKAPVGKAAKSSSAPATTEEGDDAASSNKAMLGVGLIVLLVLMIVVLALRH